MFVDLVFAFLTKLLSAHGVCWIFRMEKKNQNETKTNLYLNKKSNRLTWM